MFNFVAYYFNFFIRFLPAGLSYCVGLRSRVNLKCVIDGEAVKLLRDAGAVILVVTTTPELCLSWETINTVTGKTINPYNSHRTCGGSSGGEVRFDYFCFLDCRTAQYS